MVEMIKQYKEGTEEYEKLERMAMILTLKSPKKYNYVVGDTYFDYGQGWKWTTVLCRGGYGGYQALNPAEQEAVLLSDGSLEELNGIANEVFADKFCPDRIDVR